MKPICEDIKDMLVAAGYTFGTNLFISKQPSGVANVVTLFDTSSMNQDMLLSGTLINNSVEVLVRNSGYQAAYVEAEKIKAALDGQANFDYGGSRYVIIQLVNGPNELPTQQIAPEDTRVFLSLNFSIKRY